MEASSGLAPLVKGFYDGGEVRFINTEASDSQVAEMLTRMMGPRVVVVPGLAHAGRVQLAQVYVFTNGLPGEGPFGYQPDVFDTVPGDEGYRPLRAVNLVSWKDGGPAQQIRSVAELWRAETEGLLSVSTPRIVVNMPVLLWPGGHR